MTKPTFFIAPSNIAYSLIDSCMACNWYQANMFLRGFSPTSGRVMDFAIYNAVDKFFKKAEPLEFLQRHGIPATALISPNKLKGAFETDLCIYKMQGLPDMICLLEDGSFGLIEIKTMKPSASEVERFKPQIASYMHLDPRITRSWIAFFDIHGFISLEDGIFNGTWTVTEVDLTGFDLGEACDKLGRFFVMPKPPHQFWCQDCDNRIKTARAVLSASQEAA